MCGISAGLIFTICQNLSVIRISLYNVYWSVFICVDLYLTQVSADASKVLERTHKWGLGEHDSVTLTNCDYWNINVYMVCRNVTAHFSCKSSCLKWILNSDVRVFSTVPITFFFYFLSLFPSFLLSFFLNFFEVFNTCIIAAVFCGFCIFTKMLWRNCSCL